LIQEAHDVPAQVLVYNPGTGHMAHLAAVFNQNLKKEGGYHEKV